MTRAATLLLALLLMNVLLGGICLAVSRGEARSRALRFWGTGLLLYAAGLLITILPLPAGKVAGNALIAAAPMLCVAGALEHTRTRLYWRWLWIAFGASVLPIAWNHLRAQPNVLVDFLSPAPLANLLFCIAAWTLFRAPPADARPAARFVAATFAYSVLVWTLRMALIVHSVGATNDRERADLTVALFCIAQMVSAVAATLGLLWIEVRLSQATLERVAWLDPLTNLFNRRATLLRFREELARARRADAPLALAVLDVDHFKRFNDEHGHLTGDAVLTHVASVLGQTKREGDVLGRVGGEEFVLLFAGSRPGGALLPRPRRALCLRQPRVRGALRPRRGGHRPNRPGGAASRRLRPAAPALAAHVCGRDRLLRDLGGAAAQLAPLGEREPTCPTMPTAARCRASSCSRRTSPPARRPRSCAPAASASCCSWPS